MSTTTSSGTFTVVNKEMTRCEAKKYCREKGQILAPVTNQEDKDAIMKLIGAKHCKVDRGNMFYHIGLDVTPCGETQERIFSNGVFYDRSVHGKLYDDMSPPSEICPDAYLDYEDSNPFTIGSLPRCHPQRHKFICLEQSTSNASPITREKTKSVQLAAETCAVLGVLVCAVVGVLAFSTAKFYKRTKDLEKEFGVVPVEGKF